MAEHVKRSAEINNLEARSFREHHHKLLAAHNLNEKSAKGNRIYSEVVETFMGDIVVPKSRLSGNYTFKAQDIILSPIAFTIGALNVMDDKTNGYSCSRNSTTFRTQILQAFRYFNQSDQLEAMTAIHLAGAQLDDMGRNCYYAVVNDFTEEYFDKLFSPDTYYVGGIGINLMYNVGH